MDAPLLGRSESQAALLRQALLSLPGRITAAAKKEGCDLILLSGDLFDGVPTRESLKALKDALEEAAIPVFIAPGNHDYYSPSSVWAGELWPANVHIFTSRQMDSVALPELDCRVYGAAFSETQSDSLLSGFRAECKEKHALCVLHGDPTQTHSPYNPVTAEQIRDSGLDYLALGHIHKGGNFRAGNTLCAWPGCPQGRGFDELGEKGVLIVTVEDAAEATFFPLSTLCFHDWELDTENDAAAVLARRLPPVGNEDLYRITFVGESQPLDLDALSHQFSHFPNLELRDRTVPPLDIWGSAGEDTLEGTYFGLLRSAMDHSDEATAAQIHLAARISRQILSGQEVKLP